MLANATGGNTTTGCVNPATASAAGISVGATGVITIDMTSANTLGITSVKCTYTGTHYPVSFVIAATNAAGPSFTSLSSNSVTPVDLPAAPSTAYYTGTNALGYTAGWSPVVGATSYTVTLTNGASPLTFTSTTTSVKIPSSALNGSVVYSWTITSTNAAGTTAVAGAFTGAASAPTNALAVSTYRASASASTEILGWVASTSANNCYLPATYTVYQTVGNLTTVVTSGLTATQYTVPYSATSGVTYSVVAVTDAGISPVSTSPTSYTDPTATPRTPVLVDAYFTGSSSTKAVIKWSDANSNAIPFSVSATLTPVGGGTALTCTFASTPTASTGLVFDGTGTQNYTCTVSSLTPNTSYTYSITETNAWGTGTALTGQITTADVLPNAPVIVSAVPVITGTAKGATTKYGITITWSAPAVNTGSPITGYAVFATQDGGSPISCQTVLTATSTSCTIYGFAADNANGVGSNTVSYSVAAVNSKGTGTAATVNKLPGSSDDDPGYIYGPDINMYPAPGAPPQVSALTLSYPAYGSVTATWTQTDAVTGLVTSSGKGTQTANTLTSYLCTATAVGYATVTASVTAPAGSCTLTGLSNVAYTISVQEVNDYSTTPGTATTATSVPQVSNALANFGGLSAVYGTITVQWITPVTTSTWLPLTAGNTAAITSYKATATDADGNSFSCTATSGNTCTIMGVAAATKYSVTVVPTSAVGDSSITMTNTITSLAANAAGAPTIGSVSSTQKGLTVTWTAPASVGTGQLVGYLVTATDAMSLQQSTCPYNATYGVILAPAVTCTITGLVTNDNYTISVTAITKGAVGGVMMGAAATKAATFSAVLPEPVIATFTAVTAKQKNSALLTATAKSSLTSLISSGVNDGAQVTVTGYGTTKAIALARANAAANYLFNNGAAVHVTVKAVISKTVKTALVTVTSN